MRDLSLCKWADGTGCFRLGAPCRRVKCTTLSIGDARSWILFTDFDVDISRYGIELHHQSLLRSVIHRPLSNLVKYFAIPRNSGGRSATNSDHILRRQLFHAVVSPQCLPASPEIEIVEYGRIVGRPLLAESSRPGDKMFNGCS